MKRVERDAKVRRIALGLLIALLIFLLFGLFTPLTGSDKEAGISFTPEERTWIASRKNPVVIGITMIPNQILFSENGGYRGYAIDLFKMIGANTGLKFGYRYFRNWSELIDAAKAREIDGIFLAQKTSSRLAYLDFTDRVLVLRNKIITRIDTTGPIRSDTHSTIAVTRGSAIEEYLSTRYTRAKILAVDNLLQALRLVSEGKADAAVAEPIRASYYIEHDNLNNLKIAENLGYDYYLGIASRNDWPILNVILSKAVHTISEETFKALRLKWGYVEQEIVIFDRQTLIYLGIILGIIIPFSIYLYWTNLKLQREMQARREAMTRLHELLEERKQMGMLLEKRVAEEVEKNRQQEIMMLHQNRLAQMGELISMIAHQWRQPLNNLALLNQMLYRKFQKNLVDLDEMERFVQHSRKHIDMMSKTIDDFRNFYRAEEQAKTFPLNELIDKTVEMVRPSFDQHAILLEKDFRGKCSVVGIENALAQVIHNLINNARDAMLERGVKDRRITLRLECGKHKALLCIEDTAGGVPNEIMERIFDPYFSTKSERNGTGLGLYMSKKIIEEQLGGTLTVVNTDQGACFCMELELSLSPNVTT